MKNCQILTGELSHEDDKTLTLMKYSTDTKIVGSQQGWMCSKYSWYTHIDGLTTRVNVL